MASSNCSSTSNTQTRPYPNSNKLNPFPQSQLPQFLSPRFLKNSYPIHINNLSKKQISVPPTPTRILNTQ